MKIKYGHRSEKAYIELIFAFFILVIGGIIIWQLARLIKIVLPPPANTNQVQVYTQPYGVSIVLSPLTNETKAVLPQIDQGATPFVYTLQYGISYVTITNNEPWLSSGSNMQQSVDGDVNWIVNSSNECAFTITGGSQTFMYDFSAVDGSLLNNSTNPPSVVVIERTTNLVDWYPIFTNSSCGLNTVETLTDTNGPPQGAFYRSVVYPLQTNSPSN